MAGPLQPKKNRTPQQFFSCYGMRSMLQPFSYPVFKSLSALLSIFSISNWV
nr:MAG TPA: hypothetical protein [Caudoviricetes sp.]